MTLSDLETKALDDHFLTCSYIHGYTPSQGDTALFKRFTFTPPTHLQHLHRWYTHIRTLGSECVKFPATEKDSLTLIVNDKEVSLFIVYFLSVFYFLCII